MEKGKFKMYYVARKLLEHARKHERHVTPEELDELWRSVEERVYSEKRKRTARRHVLYLATASAAAIIFLCMFGLGKQFIPSYMEDDLIIDFAKYTQIKETLSKEILLLRPGKEDLKVKDTDANIVYSNNGAIVVNSDTINRGGIEEKKQDFNQLIIPKGKRTQLTLSDGTRLWVNSGTRVIYPNCFEKKYREIYVEGEIYLDVFRNEDSPFIVRTKDFLIQVLGTSFNVSAYPSEHISSVVLVEGSVNIRNQQKEQVKLAPGQLVNIQTGKLHSPKNVDVKPYVCWVENMLMYIDEPLDKVFRKLNLYYGKEFVLESGVAELQVSGKLDLKGKLEDVLHTISFSVPIYFEEINDSIYVRKE